MSKRPLGNILSSFRFHPSSLLSGVLALTMAALIARPLFVSGQEDSSSVRPSNVERKNKAPLSTETLRVHLPKPVEAKLANGLTVLILEDHRLPSVLAELHLRGRWVDGGLPGSTP